MEWQADTSRKLRDGTHRKCHFAAAGTSTIKSCDILRQKSSVKFSKHLSARHVSGDAIKKAVQGRDLTWHGGSAAADMWG
jgi:hypothetical protein